MYYTFKLKTVVVLVVLICSAVAYASGDEDRSKLIDRVNYCCATGSCSFQDMFTLKTDAQNYLAGPGAGDDGFRRFIDRLLIGESACKARGSQQQSLMAKRSDSPTLDRLTIPAINVNEMASIAYLVASVPADYEDGLSSIYMYAQNATDYAGYAYITFDSSPPPIINMTFTFYTDFTVGMGAYNLTVALTDNEGLVYTFDYQALLQLRLQSTVIYSQSECDVGQYKAFNSSKACQPCAAGSYARKHAFTCQYCSAGQGVVGNPGTACALCPAGTYSTGASQCRQCPAGTYSQEGSYVCTPCLAGSYSGAGAPYCSPCSTGTYAREIGQPLCRNCPAGTYVPNEGASSYIPCRPGTFSTQAGASTADTCVLCAEGTYASDIGAHACVACPAGMVSPRGSTSVLKCFNM